MKPLADQMSVYAAYHRHPVNKAVHAVGIPAIVWSLMAFLGLVPLFEAGGIEVTLAHVAVAALLAWYLALDYALGVAAVAAFTVLLVTALQLVRSGTETTLWVAGAVFAFGWAIQFLGHGVWEKRRPALVDNLFQVFVAPIFIVAEAAFALGAKKGLKADVEEKMRARLSA